MKIFLTGGTGYLGGHVARAFLAAGHQVEALVRDRKRGLELEDHGASLIEGDVTAPDTWREPLGRAEAFVHTAATVQSWAEDPTIFKRVNVDATLQMVDHAAEAGVSRILAASSLFVFGPSPAGTVGDERLIEEEAHPLTRANQYVHSKRLAAEGLWKRQRDRLPVSMLYPTILLGPGSLTAGNHTATVIGDIGRGKLPGLIGGGEQIWNLVPVESAARGFVSALENGPPIEDYILGGENWTQKQLVERAAYHFGVRAPLRRLGRSLPMSLAWFAERWGAMRNQKPYLTRGEVALYDADWAFSSEKATREIGYQRGEVDATVEATANWLRDEVWPAEAASRRERIG
jgi:nucleoside-diphosphate-sugar epimerase